jgi:hypothetical protein
MPKVAEFCSSGRSVRRGLYMVFAVTTATACCVGSGIAGEQSVLRSRPKVVVFLSDDQGWGDLRVHGNTNISTPGYPRKAGQFVVGHVR